MYFALTELSRFLPRPAHHNRYLRGGVRSAWRDDALPPDGVKPSTETGL